MRFFNFFGFSSSFISYILFFSRKTLELYFFFVEQGNYTFRAKKPPDHPGNGETDRSFEEDTRA